MYTGILCRLRDAVKKKRHEKWRASSWFLLHDNAPTHRSVLANDFSAKNNVQQHNTEASPTLLAAAHFYLFPRLKSALNGRRLCGATDVIKMRWEAEKAFTKWLLGMFPTPLQSLAELYSSARGLFRRKCSLNYCTILYFSEIK